MITLNINGKTRQVDVSPDTPLLWVLRDHLKLNGTKYGCGIAQCGACTVHLDGKAVRSCQTQAADAAGKKITTIEAVGATKTGKAVQAAWIEEDVPQCGYCQSGHIMAAAALLNENPKPADKEIDAAMNGNLCRCGTYQRIRKAVRRASSMIAKGGRP